MNTMRVRLTLAEGDFTNYEIVLLNLLKGEQRYATVLLCILKFEETQ